jgi:hypothetical protein
MKLIIVDRNKPAVFERLKKQFADDLGVEVVFDRRRHQRRRNPQNQGPERRSRDRRQFVKPFNDKAYVVIYIAG